MIYVRSRVGMSDKYTEWMEKTNSWKKAWQIVRQCGAVRGQCRKWKSGGDWFLDIDELEKIGVVHNDRPMAYTNDTAAHLVYGKSRKTLCGLNSLGWSGKIHEKVDASYLCPRCERAAKKRELNIPF